MKFFFRIFFMNIFLSLVKASLSISKVVVRVPREDDIGLIFDLCITNNKDNNQRERLQFSIRAANGCSLDLGNGRIMYEAGHIIGGYFGCIEPGTTETVSLIWPTISLYNRVGCCPIIITATNLRDEQCHFKETLSFDTKFEAVDPQCTGIRKSKNYKDCNNFDLDYLDNCKPVNCEERYFGIRNFFNECTMHCEPAPRCKGAFLYDPFSNECVDSNYAVSRQDIYDIKRGVYKNYEEWNSEMSRNFHRNKFARHSKRDNSNIGDYDYNDANFNKDKEEGSTWLTGMMDGLLLRTFKDNLQIVAILLLQVFATIGIYVIICFVIFLIVSCVSRRQGVRNSISFSAAPSVSERGIPVRSRSSLVSRR